MKRMFNKEDRLPVLSAPLVLSFFGFALVGMSSGAAGVLLPSMISYYHVNNAVIGLLFLVSSVGYFLSAFSGGILIERLGLRSFLLLGALGFLIGTFSFGLEPPFVLALIARLVFGFAIGIIETGLNIYAAALPRNSSLLNYMHAFYGVGALVGPVIASTILFLNWGWNSVYLMLGGLGLLLLFGFPICFTAFHPARQSAQEEGQRGKGNVLGETLKLGVVWLAATFLLFYVGIEVSLGNWTYAFLLEGRHQDALVAGGIVSGYWLGLTLGRFVLQNLATRLGASDIELVYACMIGVTIGILLVWFVPLEAIAAFGFALIGFSLGPIYPLTVALAPKLVSTRIVPSAIGFIVSVSIIGLALFPWLAGILAQSVGIWSLLPYTIALTVVTFCLWWWTWHFARQNT